MTKNQREIIKSALDNLRYISSWEYNIIMDLSQMDISYDLTTTEIEIINRIDYRIEKLLMS